MRALLRRLLQTIRRRVFASLRARAMVVAIVISGAFFCLALWTALAFRSQEHRVLTDRAGLGGAPVLDESGAILIATIAASALMGLLVLWFARAITVRWVLEPVAKLNRAVERMIAGESGVRAQVETSGDEISALAAAFDRMAESKERRESELQQAENAVRRGEVLFRKVVEATPLAIIGVDAQGSVWLWNPAAQRIFGWSEEEVMGQPNPIVPPERWKQFMSYLEATIRGEYLQIDVSGRVRKDGSPMDMRLWASAVKSVSGAVHAVGIIEDITARRKAEEQTFRAQKMDTVGRLAAGLAHDFNNLLTAVAANSQLLMMRPEIAGAARAEVEAIDAATQKAETLTRQLLAFSRRSPIDVEVLSLNGVLSDFEKKIRPLIDGEIQIELDLDVNAGRVRINPDRLEQVLMNLALNARDAMPGGGRLTIRSESVGPAGPCRTKVGAAGGNGCVHLEVCDTGVGMAPDVQAHLFEPFFTTKQNAKGTGLGLATVFGIVRQANGEISVGTGEGRGSTFRICLPRLP